MIFFGLATNILENRDGTVGSLGRTIPYRQLNSVHGFSKSVAICDDSLSVECGQAEVLEVFGRRRLDPLFDGLPAMLVDVCDRTACGCAEFRPKRVLSGALENPHG